MSESIANSVSDSSIHLGFWTNWSHGSVKGATITLTKQDGTILTTALALFVTLVGTCFWRLFCFVIHLCFSAKNKPQDGLYHQRQAVLRNSATGVAGLWSFMQILWFWRSKTERLWAQVGPFLGAAAVVVAGFAAAGLFSSQVSEVFHSNKTPQSMCFDEGKKHRMTTSYEWLGWRGRLCAGMSVRFVDG